MHQAIRASAASAHVSARRLAAAANVKNGPKLGQNTIVPVNEDVLRSEDRDFILDMVKKYDKDGNGKLQVAELKALMTDLNDGIEPSDQEVELMLSKADKDSDGYLQLHEFRGFIMGWYASVEADGDGEGKGGKEGGGGGGGGCSCCIS